MSDQTRTPVCGIEEHAVLYALLVREALRHGEAGDKAARDATCRYGRERGARMAQYAIAAGEPRTRAAYRLFKEWRAPKGGLNQPGPVLSKSPTLVSTQDRCEWTESWKRHELLEYGKLYCRYVDRYLCRGWLEDYEVVITSLLSEGDGCCTFDWGYELTDELERELSSKAAAIGDRYVRDFDYHTGHLFRAMTDEFEAQLGPEASAAIAGAALEAFTERFGPQAAKAMRTAFP